MIYRPKHILCSFAVAGVLVIGTLCLLDAWSAPALAETAVRDFFVSSSGTGVACAMNEPCLITVALTLAMDGDTIFVEQGTYTSPYAEVIQVSYSITLFGGWDGAISYPIVRDPVLYPTTLDGEYARRVILMTASVTPTIDGFIITRGDASNAATGPGRGGGIYSINASPIIANNVISGNVADVGMIVWGRGGGVYIEDPGVQSVITGNVVYSNVASLWYIGYGGGVYLEGGTEGHQIVNNVVLSNTASITGGDGVGGGISLYLADGALLTGNTIEHNVGTASSVITDVGDGGGVYCTASDDVDIVSNTVQYNAASLFSHGGGGGIRSIYCDRISILSNTIRYNTSTDPGGSGEGSGGGLVLHHSLDAAVDSNLIISNTAHRGGGVFVGRNSSFTMTNNIVAENYSGLRGGGMSIEAYPSDPITGTLVHNTIAANDLGTGAGRNAINVPWADVTLVLTNNIIVSHEYGIAVGSGSTADLDHTLFYNNATDTYGADGPLTNTNAVTGQSPLLDSTYRLMRGSPAIAAGLTLGWPALDIDGEARLLSPPDIGADHYVFRYQTHLPLVLRDY